MQHTRRSLFGAITALLAMTPAWAKAAPEPVTFGGLAWDGFDGDVTIRKERGLGQDWPQRTSTLRYVDLPVDLERRSVQPLPEGMDVVGTSMVQRWAPTYDDDGKFLYPGSVNDSAIRPGVIDPLRAFEANLSARWMHFPESGQDPWEVEQRWPSEWFVRVWYVEAV